MKRTGYIICWLIFGALITALFVQPDDLRFKSSTPTTRIDTVLLPDSVCAEYWKQKSDSLNLTRR